VVSDLLVFPGILVVDELEVLMVKRWQTFVLTIFLAACASEGLLASPPAGEEASGSSGMIEPVAETEEPIEVPQTLRADLEDLGPAPELGNEVWLNTDKPLRLEDLRGNVVLLDMWTFG
jgi:hypothetical protein